MLLKYRSVIVIVLLAVVALGAGAGLVLTQGGEKPAFSQDGYVLGEIAETPEGTYASTPVQFKAGTNYQSDYKSDLVFEDAQNSKIALEDYGYMHYTNGAIAAFKPGVVMNLDRLNSEGPISYAISPNTAVEKAGTGFSVEHLDQQIPLESMVWKLNDNQYLFAGDSLELQIGGETKKINGNFVEINYVDSGVIEIATENEAVLTVSPLTKLSINDDVDVDLVDRTVQNGTTKIPFNKMIVDAASNIDVSGGGNDTSGVIIPTFTVIDGENGAEGAAGAGGQAGAPGAGGTGGTQGTGGDGGDPGDQGATGIPGPAGPGSDPGDPGDPGSETVLKPNIPDYELPKFTLESWDVNAFQAKGTIAMDDKGKTPLVGDPTLAIYNNATGLLVPGVTFNTGSDPFTVNTDNLDPGQEYRMEVKGSYIVDGVSFDKIFLSKVFIADDIGVAMSYKSAGVDSITVNVFKEAYSYATEVQVKAYLKSDGMLVSAQPNISLVPGDNLITFSGLSASEQYIFRMSDLVYTTPDGPVPTTPGQQYGLDVPGTTLKDYSAVTVAAPYFKTDRTESTFTFWPSPTGINVQWADASWHGMDMSDIVSYRYEFFNDNQFLVPGGPDLSASQAPIKTVVATTRAQQTVDVSMTSQLDPANLQWLYKYRVRLVVEYTDNQYIREAVSDFTGVVSLSGTSLPIVTWLPSYLPGQTAPSEFYDRVMGTINVKTNGATIDTTTQPLTLKFENTDIDHVFEVNVNPNTSTVSPDLANLESSSATEFNIAVNVPTLAQKSNYVVSLWAYTDLHEVNTSGSGAAQGVKLMSLGRMPVKTVDSQIISLFMNVLPAGDAARPAGSSFAVATFATSTTTANSAAYEASNLGEVVYELYDGYDENGTLLGRKEITSSNSNPQMSTLDDANGFYKGGYPTTIPENVPDQVVLTEADFNVLPSTLVSIPVVTIIATKATDYTAAASSAGIFVNEFALVEGDPVKAASATTALRRQIQIDDGAPVPPAGGQGAVTVTPVTEGSSGITGYTPRAGVDSNTVIGFTIKANYSVPSQVDKVTYRVWQSKQHYTTAPTAVDSPVIDIQASELLDTNRTQIPTGGSYQDITLPVNVENSSKVIPTLYFMFGAGTDTVITGNGTDTTFYVYMSNTPGHSTSYASEAEFRGYTYYATYTALLNIPRPDGQINTDYIYPNDYSLATSTMQLYSSRASAPKQAATFARYPQTTDAASETWKYKAADMDGVIPVSGNQWTVRVLSEKPGEVDRDGNVSLPDSTLNYSGPWASAPFMTLKPGSLDLYQDGTYTAYYEQKLWNYAVNEDATSTVKEIRFDPRFHQTVYDDSAFKTNITDTSSQQWTIYDNPAKNSVFFGLNMLSAALAKEDYNRVAAIKVNATVSGSKNASYILPIDIVDADPNTPGSQIASGQLSYAALNASGFNAAEVISFTVSVIYDTGVRGFGVPAAGLAGYAIQTVGKSMSSPETRGNYYILSNAGVFLPTAAHTNASGQYYDINSASTVFDPEATPATLKYTSVGNQSDKLIHSGNINFIFDADSPNGPRNAGSTAEYVALKALRSVDLDSPTANTITMATVVPEVRDFSVVRGLTSATVSFTVFGGDVIEQTGYAGPARTDITSGQMGKWIVLPIFERTTLGDTLVREVWLDWTGAAMNQKDFTIALGDPADPSDYIKTPLTQETNYMLMIMSKIVGKNGDATTKLGVGGNVDNGGKNGLVQLTGPPPEGPDQPKMYLYDVTTEGTGRQYQFSTNKALVIGSGEPDPVKVSYVATEYNNKRLDLEYTVSQPGGYNIKYIFDRIAGTSPATTADTFEYSSSLGALTLITKDSVPLPLAPVGSNFWVYGAKYTVKIEVSTKSSPSTVLTTTAPSNFTLKELNPPAWVMSATPSADTSSTSVTLKVSPIDPDRVVVNSKYKLRVYNTANPPVDVTPPSIRSADYTFSNISKVQTIILPRTVNSGADGNLLDDTDYTVELYAVTDMQNEGTPADIATIPDVNLISHYQRTLLIKTLGLSSVQLGDVTAESDGNHIRLNFEGAVGLNNITKISYTVYSSDATFTFTTPASIPFTPLVNSGVIPPVDYFVLQQPNIPSNGLYYVTAQFYNSGNTLVGTESITYRRK